MSFSLFANDDVSKVSRGPKVGAHLTRGTCARAKVASPKSDDAPAFLTRVPRAGVPIALAISAPSSRLVLSTYSAVARRFGDFPLLSRSRAGGGNETISC